jgi:hypothetical protein
MPIRQLLAPHRLGIAKARRAQDSDKDQHWDDFARETIDHLASSAGQVDEYFLAGEMGLAHRRLQPARPNAVQIAEPGIAAAGMGRARD